MSFAHLEMPFRALVLGVAVVFSACATVRPASDAARAKACLTSNAALPELLARTVAESRSWLSIVPYTQRAVYDAASGGKERRLARHEERGYLAILSYADPGGALGDRSFVYDNALALLWFTWIGAQDKATGLAETLLLLQNRDGSWGSSFAVQADGYYDASYVRSGVVAWVVHALRVYSSAFAHPRAVQGAARGAKFLRSQIVRVPGDAHRGLVRGGRGAWFEGAFVADRPFEAAVTEHQLDAHVALAGLHPRDAKQLSDRIVRTLWLPHEGRFAAAADKHGVNVSRALDAAGGWGALWLLMIEERELAAKSFAYGHEKFRIEWNGIPGYRPYLDPLDGALAPGAEELVFVEGSLGMALAAHRLDHEAIAHEALRGAAELACLHGPGVPYANVEQPDFPARPAAASTLWFLLVERELRIGEPAPLFHLPASSEDKS